MRIKRLGLIFAAASLLVNGASAQSTPSDKPPERVINIDDFDGYEDWPMVLPETRHVDNAKLSDQRIIFNAQFPGPQGLGGPLENTTMMFDVKEVFFKGRPALWLQWTSTSSENATPGAASLDYLIVDRATHRTMHRIQSLGGFMGPPEWTGPFAIINYPEGKIFRTLVNEDGTAKTETIEAEDTGTIDFAALPFWLPFIDLKKGMKFRVPHYRGQLNELGGLPIYVKGRKKLKDAHGKNHKVWNVQVLSISGVAVTEFYISEEAPYFMGWDFRLTESGNPVSTMTYNKHWDLAR